ncbi:MAG TPA: hypothetical protein VHA30_02940, partial [Patescibacteria group bacterium]|nr:hypothetical protein [Patescibacteria group bacterium]
MAQKPQLTSSRKRAHANQGQMEDILAQTRVALRKGRFFDDELFAVHKSGAYAEEYQLFMHYLAARLMTPVFNLTGAIKLLGATNVVTYSQHLATFSRP